MANAKDKHNHTKDTMTKSTPSIGAGALFFMTLILAGCAANQSRKLDLEHPKEVYAKQNEVLMVEFDHQTYKESKGVVVTNDSVKVDSTWFEKNRVTEVTIMDLAAKDKSNATRLGLWIGVPIFFGALGLAAYKFVTLAY